MAKINKLKKDDILRAVNIPDSATAYNRGSIFKRGGSFGGGSDDYVLGGASSIDEALKKIAKAGEDFVSMKDYARALIKRFDNNNDGVITF